MNKFLSLNFPQPSNFDPKPISDFSPEQNEINQVQSTEEMYKSELTRFLQLKTHAQASNESDDFYLTQGELLDQLAKDIGNESDEEEGSFSDDISSNKSSVSKKKNSQILFSSPKIEGLGMKKKFGSFMSETSHQIDYDMSKKRISLLEIVNDARNKKRNSDINGLKMTKPIMNKITRKGMFDTIMRSSWKLGNDISIIKTISSKVENSHSTEFYTPKSQNDPSTPTAPSFTLQLNQIKFQEEKPLEIEEDITDDQLSTYKNEMLLKLSIFKYDGRIFQPWDSINAESLKQLRDDNMLDMDYDEVKNENLLPGLLHPSEIIIKKSASRESRPPFYLASERGLLKTTFLQKGSKIFAKSLPLHVSQSNTINIFKVNSEIMHLEDKYKFLLSSSSAEDSNDAKLTFSLINQNYCSHILDKENTKSLNKELHIQIKYMKNHSAIQEELPKNDSNKILIRDNFSKSGTFVKLMKNNPVSLRVGNLFMSNSNVGYYVKRISDEPVDELNGLEDVSKAYEIICLNKKLFDKDLAKILRTTSESDFSFERKIQHAQRKEYERLLQTKNIPHILLHIVKWNSLLSFYEELGFVYLIYNTEDYSKSSDMNFMRMSHGIRNFANLNDLSITVQKVMPRNLLNFDIGMGFDPLKRIWFLDLIDAKLEMANDVKSYEVFCSNLELEYKFEECNQFSKYIKSGLNLLSLETDTSDRGIWMSVSQFDILQEKFTGNWTEVGENSMIKMDDTIFMSKIQSFYTI